MIYYNIQSQNQSRIPTNGIYSILEQDIIASIARKGDIKAAFGHAVSKTFATNGRLSGIKNK